MGRFNDASFLGQVFCFGSNDSSPAPFPCRYHAGTARGSCKCARGFKTLVDGSFDFQMIEEEFRAVLCNGGLCNEGESLAHLFGRKLEIAADSGHTEKASSLIGTCDACLFSYDELSKATNSFRSKKLGTGGFGSVYLGNLKDGRRVAVKAVYDRGAENMGQFFREISIFYNLRHPNIITFHGCNSGYPKLLLVYEYVANGSLADNLHGRRKMDSKVLIWDIRLRIAIETADALAYLHFRPGSPSIIHCDIKTENILLDETFHAKVGDFGMCVLFSSSDPGTQGYLDPEYEQSLTLTDKSDVYSFGVVLLELISGIKAIDVYRVVDEDSMDDAYLAKWAPKKIRNSELEQFVDRDLQYQSDPEIRRMIDLVAELACWCLEPEGSKRPSMAEVVTNLTSIRDGTQIIDNDKGVEQIDDDVRVENVVSLSPGDPAVTSRNDYIAPEESTIPDISSLLPVVRLELQEEGFTKLVEKVRSSYKHELSSIILFWAFKSRGNHLEVPPNDPSPWGISCGCRAYLQSNRVLEGLRQSTCFLAVTFTYILFLCAINDTPPHIMQPIVDYIFTQRVAA